MQSKQMGYKRHLHVGVHYSFMDAVLYHRVNLYGWPHSRHIHWRGSRHTHREVGWNAEPEQDLGVWQQANDSSSA